MGGRVKPLLLLLSLIAGLVLLVRLGPGRIPARAAQPATEIEGDEFPLLLIDPVGGRRELSRPPRRIASVTLGSDELLLELAPHERIAALTHLVDDARYSAAGAQARDVAGRVSGNAEEILAAGPDLVLIAAWTSAGQVKLLAGSGVPVYRLREVATLDDLYRNATALARLCGVRERGTALVRGIEGRLAAIEARLPPVERRPRALFLTRDLWTGGSGTTVQIVLGRAGARNVAAERGRSSWGKISPEEVLAWDPDVVVLNTAGAVVKRADEWLARQPGLSSLRAVRERRVWAIPARKMTSTSHHMIDAVELLHRALYGAEAR